VNDSPPLKFMPDCMLPDGAEPCDGYKELLAELLIAEKLDDDDQRLVAARLAADTALKGTP